MNVEVNPKGDSRARHSRKYAHAPITEAIIELRLRPVAGVTPVSCKSIFDSVRDQFPEKKELMVMHAQISGGAKVGAQATQELAGYTLHSADRSQSVSASPDRFSFSQLPPYDSWEAFCPAARRLWEIYRANARPEAIVRIATRFVNRIEIPMPIKDISDYFRTAPVISPDMPQALSGYFMQMQLPQNDIGCGAILNEALLASTDGAFAPFILDIDIFDEGVEFSSDVAIWERLLEFRWRKNEIFEACITDRVRELIS